MRSSGGRISDGDGVGVEKEKENEMWEYGNGSAKLCVWGCRLWEVLIFRDGKGGGRIAKVEPGNKHETRYWLWCRHLNGVSRARWVGGC